MIRIKRFIKFVRDAIMDPERDFSERVFLILTLISELTVPIALIGDIVTGENPVEIAVLIAVLILVPLTTFPCLYKDRLYFAIRFIVTTLVFAVLPALFFTGGGLHGGGVLWFIFGFIYVGLVISGNWRKVMTVSIFVVSLACYLTEYYHPELIVHHSRQMFFVDSFISLILVGVVCFFMTWSQNQLYMSENKRARKETERAEELSRSQNRFFSSMSHEIRTPINSILGLNELILRDQDVSDEIINDANGIQGAGKLLLALINDILDFSKMEAGSMAIVPTDYRTEELITEIVNMIWLKARDKGLEFDVRVDPEVPSVLYGDEVRIKQVMINLLNNAVKYTSEGSVELRIECEDKDADSVVLSISVADTGMGIKKEALPYLFDVFKRVDEKKNRYIEGTGLGLSIVKQLVELMGGSVNVNSVYGDGSTFTVNIKQGISDHTGIGELNIHNQQMVKRAKYESSFKAPDVRLLIVDDNEMNLDVEKKLLLDTDMTIDTSNSGAEALKMCLKYRYDVILMDHLMPEMDGIECLKNIRNQSGGMNRYTPIIVLTANAGSQNREMYNREGFDGYLVKPVSGEALEEILMKHINRDKLFISDRGLRMRHDINTSEGYSRKAPVIITTTSMSDIPDELISRLDIPILPFLVHTEHGVFKDSTQMDANELIRYIGPGKNAVSAPPDAAAHTEFFAKALKRAHSLIHIALTTSMSADYFIALEAAGSFDNVTVINSGCVSSSAGILVLIACKLAQMGTPTEEIVKELENVKQRLKCSFVIDTTEYMAKKELISSRVNSVAKVLELHPCISFKDDKYRVSGLWMGSTRRAYKRYIRRAFPVDVIPDSEVVFITYVDVPNDTLEWIKEEISKIAYFEHVVFKQASAAISSNCGPGSFGILYFVKSNKSYNIGSFFDTDDDDDEEEIYVDAGNDASAEPKEPEKKWYQQLEFIDGDAAVANSGSEEAFKSVLKIFFDSVPIKAPELDGYYSAGDWKNYTIKIHALKSSAKLIGAMDLSEKAQALEKAGKEGNRDFIVINHKIFIDEYLDLWKLLGKSVFVNTSNTEEISESKPEAEAWLMDSVYTGLREAADDMDCDAISDVLSELSDYTIPASDVDVIEQIRQKAANYDYDGILEILNNK